MLSILCLVPAGECLLCRCQSPQPGACPDCLDDLQHLALGQNICSHCSLPLDRPDFLCGHCLRQPPDFSLSAIPFSYHYPLDHLITQFKYSGCHGSGRLLSCLLNAYLQTFYRTHPAVSLPDLVIATPLHWRRRWQRGFNQSEYLARRAAAALERPCINTALKRQRATQPQQGLSKRHRSANVKGAFMVPTRQRARLQNKCVALVDDVVTTTTTAREISRVLIKAGAKDVHIWALARTPDHM
ncbi:MAG TPA: ComF family protein [Cellvibrionaceae bacterium]